MCGGVAGYSKWLDNSVQGLVLELYRNETGDLVSESNVIKDFISKFHASTKGQGIHVIDRGRDSGVKHYFKLNQKSVIRL